MSEYETILFEINPVEDGTILRSPEVRTVWSACKTYFKIKFCVSVKAHINGIFGCISIAGYEQCFGIGGNGCFDFEMGVARAGVCIQDFRYKNGCFCFTLKVRACVGVKIPMDGTIQKCKTLWKEDFCIPFYDADLRIDEVSSEEQLAFLQNYSAFLDE